MSENSKPIKTDTLPKRIVIESAYVGRIYFKKDEGYQKGALDILNRAIENDCPNEAFKIRTKILQIIQSKLSNENNF